MLALGVVLALVFGRTLAIVVHARLAMQPVRLAFPNLPAEQEFAEVGRRLADSRSEFFGRDLPRARRSLLPWQAGSSANRVRQLQHQAWEQVRWAEVDRASHSIAEARRLADHARLPDAVRADLLWTSVLVHLRQAEQQNCVGLHCAQSCLFPIERGGRHLRREAATKARQDLIDLLALRRQDAPQLGWLLNVVTMTLGEYPLAVPEPYRLAPERFAPEAPCPVFPDVAGQRGLGRLARAGSVAVDDYDNDGRLDLFTVSIDYDEPAQLLRYDATGKYLAAANAGLDHQGGGLHCVPADYDNDGDTDVLVLRGAWLLNYGLIRNSLLRNDGAGRFTDVTRAAGLAEPALPTQTAVWGDFDNDGDLDLFVGNESQSVVTRLAAAESWFLRGLSDDTLAWLLRDARFPSQFYRNNGDGTFRECARECGIDVEAWCKGACAGDFDNDGLLDLFVSTFSLWNRGQGTCRLFRNRGAGHFEDATAAAGVPGPPAGFACWFFDYDNDGWLDLWVASNVVDLGSFARGLHQAVPPSESSRVYHNEGGTFRDATAELGCDRAWLTMGASFGDLDHDGWLDVYLGTGAPAFEMLVPNVMLRNDAGRAFRDVSAAGRFGHLQKGHGIAFADFDNDGDQDIFADLGGFFPADRFTKSLFLNPGGGGHYLYLKLHGSRSNASAIGARVRVDLETPAGPRSIHRAAGAISSFGSSPSRLEIGLGDARAITRLEVTWPASGQQQVFTQVPLDTSMEVWEEGVEITPRALQPFSLEVTPAAY